MAVGLFADVHVTGSVIMQLSGRGVDIVAATEEGTNQLSDEELLAVATSLRRVMLTRISDFECWRRTGSETGALSRDWCSRTSDTWALAR
jgi:hypothetical protein